MTNEQNGLSGIENLTPFEYALAGVNPSSSQDSPSLAVVEQMRALAAEVQDAPITQPRLQELMQGNAGATKRNERRALKRRRATADGGFVDITPAELNQQNQASSNEDSDSDSNLGSIAGVAALGGLAAGASALDDGHGFAETDPTSEQPAINLEDVAGSAADVHMDTDITDPIQLGLDGVVADPAGELDATEPVGLAEEDFERQFDAIQAAMLESEPDDAAAFYDIPIEGEAVSDELADVPEDHADLDHTATDGDALVDDPIEAGMPGAAGALGVSVFDTPLPSGEQLFDQSDAELRDTSGRFANDHLFEPEPALTSDEVDPGTPVLVPAGGEGLLLDEDHDDDRSPLAVAALTGTLAPPVVPERRFGGAFWALAGTAAAAAVLALGGLLWANSLNDGTTTESAAPAAETSAEDDTTEVSADGTSEGSTESGDEDTSTGAMTDSTDENADRPALAVDGEDTGSSTTLDPSSTTVTTIADGADESGEATATTAAVVTETTVTETTADPDSTVPTTTEPPAPDEPTTVAPTTEAPAPEPTPAPTAAPVIGPSFIGDRITLGSFEGPGLGGVRVRLFSDTDRNGAPEQRLAIDDTDEGGFYGFDEFPAGCYVVEFSRIPSGLTLDAAQTSQAFCIEEGDQNGRFDAVAVVAPPDNCIVEASNNFSDRGVEVHENDFDRADSYTFYDLSGRVVFRTSQVGPPDDLDDNPYGDYEWFAEESGFNHRSVRSVAAERFGVESAPITCERQ